LELPPDEQKVTRRPDAKVISDKDRIATSKAPQINREELKKILQSPHPGQPGRTCRRRRRRASRRRIRAQNPAPPAPQENPQGFAPPQPSDQTARLQTPPQNRPVPNFKTPHDGGLGDRTSGAGAAANPRALRFGQAGDGGLSPGRRGAKAGLAPAEILTDTMGVDFGPYMTRIVQIMKQNWILGLPPSAYPPIFKQGKLRIEFTSS
jgi:hypothetical protein